MAEYIRTYEKHCKFGKQSCTNLVIEEKKGIISFRCFDADVSVVKYPLEQYGYDAREKLTAITTPPFCPKPDMSIEIFASSIRIDDPDNEIG